MAAGHALDRLLQVGIDVRVVEDRLRVDADGVVDDELEPRQPDPGVGHLREVERQLRIADVHHDLDPALGQHATHDLGDFGLEQAVVDIAGVALGAGHGDECAILEHLGRVATAHHCRDAELARNDRRVAGAATAVGDDGAGPLHHRLPIRVGHVGHQHVAGLHLVHLGDAADQPDRAGADLLADRAALGQHRALGLVTLELEALLGLALGLALHRLGPRLQDVELAVAAVAAPLDVHRAAVVALDDQRVVGQLGDLNVTQRVAVALLGWHVDGLDQLAGGGLLLGRGEHHLDQLAADVAADHGLLAGFEHRLVDVELVGVHRALHHRLAQAVAGGDEHHVLEAALGVDREHHAGRAQVAADHALHTGRQRHVGMGKALVHAVADGAVVVERGKDLADLVQHRLDAHHIEKTFLLTGEAGIGQVFGGGRRAHRERGLGVVTGQRGERGANGRFQVGRERCVLNPATDLGAGRGQRTHVFGVQRIEPRVDLGGQPAMGQKLAKGMRRGRKAGWHPHAGSRKLADHFAETRVLAADRVDVVHAQLLEGHDQSGRIKQGHGETPEVKKPALTKACAARRGN